ncbi:MAG: biotin--[acetyl-CoA-carboxylase] ligase [Ruminococcaceae bacterium]|nr:biotin--[acetyl-CoA-carboxylase] ligase [Oscillospiraceae bacterium]
MATKEKLLALLEQHTDEYASGQEIAEQLGISRAAVWKAIRALERDGCRIHGVTGLGYRLESAGNRIHAAGIHRFLSDKCDFCDLRVYPVLPSTNDTAKALAAEGAPEGTVVIAESQTAGKGRMRRQFFSPGGTGIYMSILLRPQISAEDALDITTAAAAAVADAIDAETGKKSAIKWVNDVFLDGKKVCGILTEGAMGMEDGSLEYAILGIGINAVEPEGGFPEELREIAGAVWPADSKINDCRNRLIAAVLTRFFAYYRELDAKTFLRSYQSRSLLRGKSVNVIRGNTVRPAIAGEIDNACRLQVTYEDGSEEWISSGEVSVHSTEGYR